MFIELFMKLIITIGILIIILAIYSTPIYMVVIGVADDEPVWTGFGIVMGFFVYGFTIAAILDQLIGG